MTFGGLNISTSGMQAAQVGLDIAGQNIANTNTVGYSRKAAILKEGLVSENRGLSKERFYSGVVVDNIRRIRDIFLDQQIRNQASNLGFEEVKADLNIAMNDILGEPSDSGLSAKLNQFFQSAKDLATNPELETAKTVFINSASALTGSFNQVDQSIALLKNNIDTKPTGRIASTVNNLNALLLELSDVHKEVLAADGRGVTATELEDRRDLLLDKISKIVNINIDKDGSGSLKKLSIVSNASEAKVTGTLGFLNFDSTIAGITTATNTLTMTANNGNGVSVGPFTVNFEAGSSIRQVVEKINRTFTASGGKGTIASVDNSGRLVLETKLMDSSLNTATAEINITGGTALAALGLTAGSTKGSTGTSLTLLDSQGLDYIFDVEEGNNSVDSFASKLILRNNDAIQSKVGIVDSFSGELGGMFEMTNKEIPELRKMLSEFAMSIKDLVNDLLELGKTSGGSAGLTLFTGDTAADFGINSTVSSNSTLLAQGKTGSASDGSIASEIADLFFGTNNIVSDNARSQMVFIDSPSTANVQSKIPMVPGQQITIHADGLVTDGASSVNAGDNGFGGGSLVQIEFTDSSGNLVGSTINFPTSAGAPEDRVSYTSTVPAGAAFVRFKMNGTTFNDNDLTDNVGHFKMSIIQGTENDSSTNFNNKISDIVGEFGTRGNVAISKSENAENLFTSLENRRQSVMGVSLEEEAADLIRFQNTFSANARVMSAMNEVLETLVNLI